MLHGFATPEGTSQFTDRFPAQEACGFYPFVRDIRVSALGMGTYLGDSNDITDRGYERTALAALRQGINFFDTAINYRAQRSEHALGNAFRLVLNSNEIQREEFVICTKAGFLTPGAIPESLQEEGVAGAMHSMHPDFLEDQLNRSRANLGLDTIDVFYLHNPETQLSFVPRDEVERRLQLAFERLERLASHHVIRWYGVATWNGFRDPAQLDLQRIIDLARYVGGEDHRFRFVQLPFNFGMVDAYSQRNQEGISTLKIAARAGVTTVASATLAQSQFANDNTLPDVIKHRMPGIQSSAARAIQFTRSTPGISVALVGMSSVDHLRENLEVAGMPPLGTPDYEKLYRPVDA